MLCIPVVLLTTQYKNVSLCVDRYIWNIKIKDKFPWKWNLTNNFKQSILITIDEGSNQWKKIQIRRRTFVNCKHCRNSYSEIETVFYHIELKNLIIYERVSYREHFWLKSLELFQYPIKEIPLKFREQIFDLIYWN